MWAEKTWKNSDKISAFQHFGISAAVCAGILSMLPAGCAKEETAVKPADRNIRIMAATDIHYLSGELYDLGPAMQSVIASNDGKLTDHSVEILAQLMKDVREEKPDVFVVTGDLTNNGEKRSMEDLYREFSSLEEEGIPVLVIPGNHDISYPLSVAYLGEKYSIVENVSQKQFTDLMGDFGYDEALMKDENSFSYIYALREDLWLMCLDANTEKSPGSVLPETVTWMEEALKEAEKERAKVIVFSHQNILPQNDMLWQNFVIGNYAEVRDLLYRYGVKNCYSGHSHLEHESFFEDMSDRCVGALSVAPLSYSVISVNENSAECIYEKAGLGVLEKEAEERFMALSRKSVAPQVEATEADVDEKEIMTDFAARFNCAAFAGSFDPDMIREYGFELWEKYAPESFWFAYMKQSLTQ